MPLVPIPRVSPDIAFATFRDRYLSRSRPVIIANGTAKWPAHGWSAADVAKLCGEETIQSECDPSGVLTYDVIARSITWAGLSEVSGDGISTVSQLVALQNASGGTIELLDARTETMRTVRHNELYLHDKSIDTLCPALLDAVRVPRFFPVDHMQQIGAAWARHGTHKCATSRTGHSRHPSLFLGPAQSRSGLHADGQASRFWMAVLSGTKRFRLVSPEDGAALSRAGFGAQPGCGAKEDEETRILDCDFFEDTLFGAASERRLLDDTDVFEGTLTAGDIIFIPNHWPHEAINDAASVAVSYNFVDDYNLALVHHRRPSNTRVARKTRARC